MSLGMGTSKGLPVGNVTQYAASQFCKWLSAKTGHFYRLPTEAEWEYSARAGSSTAYYFGDDPKMIEQYAWSFENSEDSYHPVGQKKPNAWGLYDMHGNVAEWTLDQYPKSKWWNTDAPYVGFRIVRDPNVPKETEINNYWGE